MEKVNNEVIYIGKNYNIWQVKEYLITENRGFWTCSCSIKYSRDPKLKCKHISLVENFLLSDEEKERLRERHDLRLLREKIKSLDLKACKNHLFIGYKEKGAIVYECNQCKSRLTLDEYKFYGKCKNLR